MTVFRYRVFDRSGKISVRRVDAVDRRAAETRLREEGSTILKALSGVGGGALAKLAIRRRGKFDLCDFTGKLLPLLQAHVQLPKALRIIGEGTGNPAEREVVEALSRGLREGRKFSALLRESGKFPPLYWSLCEVGEETGNLTGVVAELYGFLARSKATREFLITSSIYPAILVTVTILVVLAVFIFFLPYFAGIFTDMGRELPSAARARTMTSMPSRNSAMLCGALSSCILPRSIRDISSTSLMSPRRKCAAESIFDKLSET